MDCYLNLISIEGSQNKPIRARFVKTFQPRPMQRVSGRITYKTVTKRQWCGAKNLIRDRFDNEIPIQSSYDFHPGSDIREDCCTIPDRKNFAAVDSVAAGLGEMYQLREIITS